MQSQINRYAINRCLYKNQSFVETAIYRVLVETAIYRVLVETAIYRVLVETGIYRALVETGIYRVSYLNRTGLKLVIAIAFNSFAQSIRA